MILVQSTPKINDIISEWPLIVSSTVCRRCHEEGQELNVFLCVGMTHVELQQLDSYMWLSPHLYPILLAHTLCHKVAC